MSRKKHESSGLCHRGFTGQRLSRRDFMQWTACVGAMTTMNGILFGCNNTHPASRASVDKNSDFVMATAVDLYTIDPAVGFDTAIGNSLVSLYDSLFRYVGNPPSVIPWLARHYRISPGATRWTFFMETHARFHDGTPVTAHAAKFSLERLLRINKGPASLFKGIVAPQGILVPDPYTLVINLQKPFGAFLDLLPWLFVVNPDRVSDHAGEDDGQGWLKDHDAGSGPFTIGRWKPGDLYEFHAVDHYWKGWPGRNHLKKYTRRVIKVAADRLATLSRGEAHMADWIPPEELVQIQSSPGFQVIDEPSMAVFEIKMNNHGVYTSNRRVRKALAYAFDYRALLDIWKGRARLTGGPLPPVLQLSGHNAFVYGLNMNHAKSELAQSPWPNGGFDLEYAYVAGLEEEHEVGHILKRQLARLNIDVHIIPITWADAVSMFKHPKTAPDLFPIYSLNAYPDPDNYLWAGYHSSRAGQWTNPGHYRNSEMDHLLEKARAALSSKERDHIYLQACELALSDAANIFGVSTMDAHVYADNVKGIKYCPVTCNDEDFYWMRLEK